MQFAGFARRLAAMRYLAKPSPSSMPDASPRAHFPITADLLHGTALLERSHLDFHGRACATLRSLSAGPDRGCFTGSDRAISVQGIHGRARYRPAQQGRHPRQTLGSVSPRTFPRYLRVALPVGLTLIVLTATIALPVRSRIDSLGGARLAIGPETLPEFLTGDHLAGPLDQRKEELEGTLLPSPGTLDTRAPTRAWPTPTA